VTVDALDRYGTCSARFVSRRAGAGVTPRGDVVVLGRAHAAQGSADARGARVGKKRRPPPAARRTRRTCRRSSRCGRRSRGHVRAEGAADRPRTWGRVAGEGFAGRHPPPTHAGGSKNCGYRVAVMRKTALNVRRTSLADFQRSTPHLLPGRHTPPNDVGRVDSPINDELLRRRSSGMFLPKKLAQFNENILVL